MADTETKNAASTSSNLETIYDNIIKSGVVSDTNTDTNAKDEFIDITSDFSWSRNTFKQQSSKNINYSVPQCYVVERRQTVSSSIANLLNMFNSLEKARNMLVNIDTKTGIGQKIGNLLNLSAGGDNQDDNQKESDKAPDNINVKDADLKPNILTKSISKAKSIGNSISDVIQSINDNINAKRNSSNFEREGVLSPYKDLYFTEETGKKYVFPVIGDAASQFELTNSFGDAQAGAEGGMLRADGNFVTETITSWGAGISAFASDVNNILSFLSGNSSYETNFIEKAKFYNTPSESSVNITFPLYNTIVKDSWKKNYKFLFRFYLRNMMFKTDAMTYKQPLLYDLCIQGVKRLPLCYVSDLKVKPHGIIRPTKIDKLLPAGVTTSKNSNTSAMVNVPEAWLVSITFKSLLAESANQLISSLTNPITITTTSSNN